LGRDLEPHIGACLLTPLFCDESAMDIQASQPVPCSQHPPYLLFSPPAGELLLPGFVEVAFRRLWLRESVKRPSLT